MDRTPEIFQDQCRNLECRKVFSKAALQGHKAFGRSLTKNTYGSSRPEVFSNIGVLKNFATFRGKNLYQYVLGLMPVTLLKKRSDTGVFL